jgi:hypothetical protein
MKSGQVLGDDARRRLLRQLARDVARQRPLAAADVGMLVGRTARELVQQAQRTPVSREMTADLRLQSHLRCVVEVLTFAIRDVARVADAIAWYRGARPAALGGCSPEEATVQGRVEEVCRSLALRAANDAGTPRGDAPAPGSGPGAAPAGPPNVSGSSK